MEKAEQLRVRVNRGSNYVIIHNISGKSKSKIKVKTRTVCSCISAWCETQVLLAHLIIQWPPPHPHLVQLTPILNNSDSYDITSQLRLPIFMHLRVLEWSINVYIYGMSAKNTLTTPSHSQTRNRSFPYKVTFEYM